jgi:hypothetical protein
MFLYRYLDKDKTMNRIIYKTPDGGVAVIVPSPEYLQDHTIEELAAKDVPEGAEFRIVDTVDVPTDRTWRAAWEYPA